MIKKLFTLYLLFLFFIGANNMAKANEWDKIFKQSNEVNVKKVNFKNRFGITLSADMYTPQNIKKNEKLSAIAIAGPFGAVKEQASGYYAQTLAERGFITLAFDPSYTGESTGVPRNIASPDINTEDYSAAIDFLSNQKNVDSDKIGILGICGFGGFALNAAQIDTRIKAVVTSTMYDMTRVSAKGYNDSIDEDARYKLKQSLNKQRTEDFHNKTYAKAIGLPDKLTGEEPQFVKDYWNYYKTKRGFHKNSINSNGNWNLTSVLSLINLPILAYSNEIKCPVLMIHGDNAHSRYFSEDVFKNLSGDNKKLLIIKDANHVDLYDNPNKIPFTEIEKFFKDSFNL